MSGGPLGCGRKMRYLTREKAESVIRIRTDPANPGRESSPLYCYECPVCGGWHLTKLNPAATLKGAP